MLRVTQQYVEVLGAIPPDRLRVTQQYVEVLGSIPPNRLRVTQQYVEVLGTVSPHPPEGLCKFKIRSREFAGDGPNGTPTSEEDVQLAWNSRDRWTDGTQSVFDNGTDWEHTVYGAIMPSRDEHGNRLPLVGFPIVIYDDLPDALVDLHAPLTCDDQAWPLDPFVPDLFAQLGKFIKHFNIFRANAINPTTGLDAQRKDVLDALNAGAQFVATEGLTADFESWKIYAAVDPRGAFAQFMLARLRDPQTVLHTTGSASDDPLAILARLIRYLRHRGESVARSTVSVGAVSADPVNIGAGTVFTTTVLDGVSSPGSRSGILYPALPDYAGRLSELAVPNETITLECIVAGDIAEFTWKGGFPDPRGPYGLGEEGSGDIGTVREVHDYTGSVLTNADFETFTGDEPDGWDIVAGTAGANILENTNLAHVAHGLKSLQFAATGGAAIEISQTLSSDVVTSQQRYIVSTQIKADADIASGDLVIQFEGTGYAPGADEKIEINAGDLPTEFATHAFFLNMPAPMPADLKLVVRWTDTPTSGKNLYIDDLGIAPVQYGGGIGLAVVRGTTDFSRGDRFRFTVSNDEGVFQQAFREMFGVQLPSSSAPTISDALAE